MTTNLDARIREQLRLTVQMIRRSSHPADPGSHDDLLDKAVGALRAVLDIHKPHQPFARQPDLVYCAGCTKWGTLAIEYPCRTVQAIIKALEGAE